MFYMWRVVIAIAHADGVVQDEERAYLTKIFANMDRVYGLTPEQKKAFAEDLEKPQKIADLMPYINDPECRGQLIYFGGLLARADGVLDPREDDILKKLRADQLASLHMDEIRAHAKQVVADEMFRHDLAKAQLHPAGTFYSVLDHWLMRLGIDWLD
jgi:uncharacterized tellurite resistance protein B-like protein